MATRGQAICTESSARQCESHLTHMALPACRLRLLLLGVLLFMCMSHDCVLDAAVQCMGGASGGGHSQIV